MGELSLSSVPECLSPLAEYSTNERAALTPAVKGGASAPHKVKARLAATLIPVTEYSASI